MIYTSALLGYAVQDLSEPTHDMTPLFETIVKYAPPPVVEPEGLFQMQISQLDYSSYVGMIGIGRIKRGQTRTNMPVTIVDREGKTRQGRILQVLEYLGLDRTEVPIAYAGNIVAITGIDELKI